MTVGSEILDTTIAARKPVTARLLRALRGNEERESAQAFILYRGSPVSLGLGPVAWSTIFELPLFIPDFTVGTTGTTLALNQIQLRGVDGDSDFRLKIGSDTGPTVPEDRDQQTLVTMTIDWTPSINTRVLLEVQGMTNRTNARPQASWNEWTALTLTKVD